MSIEKKDTKDCVCNLKQAHPPKIFQGTSSEQAMNDASTLLLLDADAMGVLYAHVDVPLPLKLVCRQTRAAAPAKTKTSLADVVGTVPLLAWARALGCPWNKETCACAARYGHFEVLQWAFLHVCEWDKDTCLNAA